MDEATYAGMPKELRLRIVWQRVAIPGFRVQQVEVVTTLHDAQAYPAAEVVCLYRRRWHAEITQTDYTPSKPLSWGAALGYSGGVRAA
jgi:hypothetical protein